MRNGTLAVALAAALWGTAEPTAAQSIPYGTLSVKSDRMTTEGKLFGCYLQFDAVFQDQTYRRGLPTYVGGSIGYTGNATMLLKLALRDLDAAFKPVGIVYPAAAFIETTDRANNAGKLLARYESEDSTGVLFVFNIDEVMLQAAGDMIEKKAITVAFNRVTGGSDIRLPLDLSITGLEGLRPDHSDEQVADFANCLVELMPQIEAKVGAAAVKRPMPSGSRRP